MRIIDKIILVMLSSVLLLQCEDYVRTILILLAVLSMASFSLYMTDIRYRIGQSMIYLLLCLFIPEFIYFASVFAYDCFQTENRGHQAGVSVVVLIGCFLERSYLTGWQLVLMIALILTAYTLQDRTTRVEQLEKEFIRLRDTSTELNLVLKEKNKDLMEKQDYEIYLATLRERNRIAREIHDNVGHMLSRSILQVGALKTVIKDGEVVEQLSSINGTLNAAMNNIRESVHDLHDDSIDMKQTIVEATKELQQQCRVNLDYDVSVGVPRNVKYCMIAIVKEAVSNIVKHSDADEVHIILREHPAFYQLAVEDNGSKKISKQSGEGGIGIENMKERVEAFRGTFRIQDEQGFRIFVSIPKEENNEDSSRG